MKTLAALLGLSAAAVACQAHVSDAAAPPAKPDTSVDQRGDAKPVEDATFEGVVRIQFGAWPRSNSHLWGSRFVELKRDGDRTMVRLHDEIDFQGVGMTPEQMPPTRHVCTPWEALPSEVATRASEMAKADRGGFDSVACEAHGETCAALRSWFESTSKPVAGSTESGQIIPAEDWQASYGRTSAEC